MSLSEWFGEIFDVHGRWCGSVACDTGDEMLFFLESCTAAGLRVSGICQRERADVRPDLRVDGPWSLAAAKQMIAKARGEAR